MFRKHLSWASLFFRSASCGVLAYSFPEQPIISPSETPGAFTAHLPQVKHIEFVLLLPMNNIFAKNKAYYICYHFSKDDSFKSHKVNKKKK